MCSWIRCVHPITVAFVALSVHKPYILGWWGFVCGGERLWWMGTEISLTWHRLNGKEDGAGMGIRLHWLLIFQSLWNNSTVSSQISHPSANPVWLRMTLKITLYSSMEKKSQSVCSTLKSCCCGCGKKTMFKAFHELCEAVAADGEAPCRRLDVPGKPGPCGRAAAQCNWAECNVW